VTAAARQLRGFVPATGGRGGRGTDEVEGLTGEVAGAAAGGRLWVDSKGTASIRRSPVSFSAGVEPPGHRQPPGGRLTEGGECIGKGGRLSGPSTGSARGLTR
jgi:hypothetical protein